MLKTFVEVRQDAFSIATDFARCLLRLMGPANYKIPLRCNYSVSTSYTEILSLTDVRKQNVSSYILIEIK